MIAFFRKHHKKIQEIGTGLFVWEGFNFLYDFIFYPFALAYWGLVIGGVIVFMLSMFINAFVFWLYEYMRVDWLGANALRQLEEKENKSNFERLVTWMGKKKETIWEKLASPVVLAALVLPIDPVIVAVHFQRQHFEGLSWRDWGLFLYASAVANVWWLIKIGLVVEAAKYIWFSIF